MAEKILQCGYMTGDTFAAAALLAARPDMQIVLLTDAKGAGQYADKSAHILKIYRESGVETQVTVIDMSQNTTAIVDVWKTLRVPASAPSRPTGDKDLDSILQKIRNVAPANSWPRTIVSVTGLLGTEWSKDEAGTRDAIARAWKLGTLPREQKFVMYDYMASIFHQIDYDIRDTVLVLWSRQSGKRGGAHLELDSSYAGIRQLAARFAGGKRATILLAGDERNGKLKDLARHDTHIIDVSEMWKHPVWAKHFKDATFLAQFAFYKYLSEDYRVIHLGMRSGMLEAMALMGMRTFYLEDYGSGSGNRMLGFSSNGITYDRIQFTETPGLTGRISARKHAHTAPDVADLIAEKADDLATRTTFPRQFRGHEAAEKAYAKKALLGRPVDSRNYYDPSLRKPRDPRKPLPQPDPVKVQQQVDTLQKEVAAQRGFTRTDLDTIVRTVSGAFK